MTDSKSRPQREHGRRWVAVRKEVFRRQGDTCWICGHGGSGTVDHVESLTERPDLAYELSNLRPAHGYHSPCPSCSSSAGNPVYCNEIKQGYSVERARRRIEEKTGRPLTLLDEDETPGEREW